MGSNGVKSDFSPDINQICTRGIFLDSKKGYRIRFSGNAVFDPILALKRGPNGVKSEFSPDFNEIRTKGVFLHLKKGNGVRFSENALLTSF